MQISNRNIRVNVLTKWEGISLKALKQWVLNFNDFLFFITWEIRNLLYLSTKVERQAFDFPLLDTTVSNS